MFRSQLKFKFSFSINQTLNSAIKFRKKAYRFFTEAFCLQTWNSIINIFINIFQPIKIRAYFCPIRIPINQSVSDNFSWWLIFINIRNKSILIINNNRLVLFRNYIGCYKPNYSSLLLQMEFFKCTFRHIFLEYIFAIVCFSLSSVFPVIKLYLTDRMRQIISVTIFLLIYWIFLAEFKYL